jgi:hypothetical protein
MENTEDKCEMMWENMEENSENNWKMQKKIVKRYGKYGRKVS